MPGRIVDVRGVPLAERVRGDVRVSQFVAHFLEMVLYAPHRDREHPLVRCDVLFPTVIAEELVQGGRYSEGSSLPGLLFGHVQAVSPAVTHDIGQAQVEDITDAHSEVRFSGECRRHDGVAPESVTTLADGADDGLVLRGC